jgi:small-conductance mechanosensitive channel
MTTVALVTWVITALGGLFLLVTWLSRSGMRQQRSGESGFRAPLILGHPLLAAIGLVVWIIYLATDSDALTWVALVILLIVALLGFTMFARWLAARRSAPAAATSTPGAAHGGDATAPAERHLPVAVVLVHGLLGAITLVLVLLAALGMGG